MQSRYHHRSRTSERTAKLKKAIFKTLIGKMCPKKRLLLAILSTK